VLIRRVDGQIAGINRTGLVIPLPKTIVAAALGIGSQAWLMDGEAIGDTYFAFDLLESACVDLRTQPYNNRLLALNGMIPADGSHPIHSVETAVKAASKRKLLARLKEQRREGVVFKRLDAPYTPGRPASGGTQLKCKFYATASCIVAGSNGTRRSVRLELLDGSKRIDVGNVTIPPKQPIPKAGDIIEARYLYAYRGGALYQPVYLGKRDDLSPAACAIAQLKYKGEADDEG
jgi:bifunctional non-homologous end joining protein LigD